MRSRRSAWGFVVAVACVAGALPAACSPVTRDFGTGGASASSGATMSSTTGTMTSTSSTGAGGGCMQGMTQPCYSGSAMTRNMAPCKDGTQSCKPDGTWGACTGEVLPTADDCATPVNEACIGTPAKCTGDTLWQNSFGSTSYDEADGVSFDEVGNVWVAAYIDGPTQNGLSSLGGDDVAIVGYTPGGVQQFARTWGTTDNEIAGFVRPSGKKELYLTGRLSKPFDFGCGPIATPSTGGDGWVAKITEAGGCEWSLSLGAAMFGQAIGVSVGPTGDVFVVGGRDGQVFVERITADGTVVWAKPFGSVGGNDTGVGVAATADGGVVVSGAFSNTLDFGGAAKSLVALIPNSTDTFIAKLDGNGDGVWALSGGSPTTTFRVAYRLAIDPKDQSVYSVGVFTGQIDFGTATPLSAPPMESTGFVLKLSKDGKPAWLEQLGSGGTDLEAALGVAVDSAGHVIVCGGLASTISLGGTMVTANGISDAYVAKLDRDGKPIWIKTSGVGGARQVAFHCDVNDKDEIAVTGTFDTSLNWPGAPMPLLGQGQNDVFVAKLSP